MKKRIIISIIFVLAIQPLFANYAFYKKVRNTCDAYRIEVVENGMRINGDVFTLELESKRNNFERVMLVGFAAAGRAITYQKELAKSKANYSAVLPNQVEVIVHVPVGRSNTIIMASASSSMVEKLADGSLKASDFMRQIKDSITSL